MQMKEQAYHEPVLLQETLHLLDVREGGIYVDVTFGGGGHSAEILRRLGHGKLIAFDRDADAHQNAPPDERLTLVRQDFAFIENTLHELGYPQVQGIVADLGISSHQVDVPERGFSFRYEAELDMRMDRNQSLDAQIVLNDYSETELLRILRTYGELPAPRRAVKALLRYRTTQPIRTTRQLHEAIASLIPRKRPRQYLSQLYQAIRIEVNGELKALAALLSAAPRILEPGGRIAIIAYHSLEDRMVKRCFRYGNPEGEDRRDFYGNPITPYKLLTRKALQPTTEEIDRNPRARSAKLRAVEKQS